MSAAKTTYNKKTLRVKQRLSIYYGGSKKPYYFDDDSVDVSIKGGKITLSYLDSQYEKKPLQVVYEGNDNGDGHFDLTIINNDKLKGDARLHCFQGGEFLEGYWKETYDNGKKSFDDEGMWMIYLNEEGPKP